MTFSNLPLGFVSSVNSATLTNGSNTAAYNLSSDFAVSSTTNTITLTAGESGTDDIYNTCVIEIINGSGRGQIFEITDYDGTTKVATVDIDIIIPIDTTSKYVIYIYSGKCQVQTQTYKNDSIILKATESGIDDFYKGCFIKLLYGNGKGQIRKIIGYNGTTKLITTDIGWSTFPDETTLYSIFGEHGMCPNQGAAISTTIILDGNQSSIAGNANLYVEIISGTGAGQTRKIVSLSTNTLTITPAWDTQPATNDEYVIYGGWCGEYQSCKDFSLITIIGIIGLSNGESGIIDMQMGLTETGVTKRGKYAEVSTIVPSTVHTLTVVSEFYRSRIIGMGTEINGSTQAIYNTQKSGKLTTFVGEGINETNDCEIVRSILVGKTQNNSYKNIKTDENGHILATMASPISAFGEMMSVMPTPTAQLKYTYGIHPSDAELFISHGTYSTMNVKGDGGTQQNQSVYLPKGANFTSTGNANYFELTAGGGGAFYVWFDVDNGNVDPTPGGTGIEVDITSSDTPSDVGTAAQAAIDANGNFSASVFGNIVTITNAANGDVNSVHLEEMPLTSNSTVTSSKTEALMSVTNGEGVADYAVVRSRRTLRYRPGQGAQCRFSAIYDTPVAGITQWFGLSNSTSALLIGYQDTSFGIVKRTGGLHEIRQLEITSVVGATTGTILLRVDGIDHTITLTDVSSTQVVASEIASHSYVTGLYNAESVDNKVIFVSERLGSPVGTQPFTLAMGTATNIAGTFTQLTATQSMSTTAISQNSWNIDRLDGTGPSGIIFNPLKGNVFQIQYQWLGFGAITFSIENEESSRFIPFHVIKYANSNTSISLSKPSMQLSHIIFSTTATTSKTIKSGSGSLFVEGQIRRFDPTYAVSNEHDNNNSSVTNNIILAVRNPRTFNELTSQIELVLKSITLTSTKSANNTKVTTTFKAIAGGTPSENLIYTYEDEGGSAALIATPAQGITLTGGTETFDSAVTAEGAVTIDLSSYNAIIQKNAVLYIIYSHVTPSTGNIDLSASLTWDEDQ